MPVKILIALCFFPLLLAENNWYAQSQQEEYHFPFYTGDVMAVLLQSSEDGSDTLMLVSDNSGEPLFYFSNIYAEVCETQVCYPVQLTLYWDFSGSFLGFQIPQNHPLTKAGHKEFSPFEYFQLYTLLNHPDSKLGKLDKKDLVKHNNSSEETPDAASGATIHLSTETMVSGAAFTCFTLWNKVDSVNQILTKNKSDNKMSPDVLKSKLAGIDHISPGELALLLQSADEHGQLKKFAVQKILTDDLNKFSPLKSLIISNFINRQRYIYPEVAGKLKQNRQIQKCFNNMIAAIDPETKSRQN